MIWIHSVSSNTSTQYLGSSYFLLCLLKTSRITYRADPDYMEQSNLGLHSMLMLMLLPNIKEDQAWHNYLIFRMFTGVPSHRLMMQYPFPVND